MNRFIIIFALIFLIITAFPGLAIEIGGSFRFENLAFRWDREINDGFSATDFCYGGIFYFRHKFQKFEQNLSLHAEYSYDAILKNTVRSIVYYNGNFFSFGVGPFIGFMNTEQVLPKFGITSQFRIQVPGIIFTDMGMDSTVGNQLEEDGNYQQEKSFISVGFYVPNAICSFNIIRRIFTELDDSVEIVDKQVDYSFSADIFKKNVPYKVLLTFGFQSLSKTYDSDIEHKLYSIIIGAQVNVDISDTITLTFGLDSSIYTFGQEELLGVSNPGTYLFRATAGINVNLDRIISERKLRGDEEEIIEEIEEETQLEDEE